MSKTKTTSASAKPSQTSPKTATLSRGELRRITWGPGKVKALYVVLRAGLLLVSAAVTYVVTLFTATSIVPNLFVMVQRGTGVSSASAQNVDQLIALWVAPSVFLALMVLALLLVALRALWRWQAKLGRKLNLSLNGEPTDTVTTV